MLHARCSHPDSNPLGGFCYKMCELMSCYSSIKPVICRARKAGSFAENFVNTVQSRCNGLQGTGENSRYIGGPLYRGKVNRETTLAVSKSGRGRNSLHRERPVPGFLKSNWRKNSTVISRSTYFIIASIRADLIFAMTSRTRN